MKISYGLYRPMYVSQATGIDLATHVLAEEVSKTVPELSLAAVNAWSITEFNCKMDIYGFWLSDVEASTLVETLGF